MIISLTEILIACLIMGLGIGADVALATFLRANSMKNKRTALFWISGVTLTHTVFPMMGYLLAHYSIDRAPVISPFIGLIAFSFIAYFVIQELKPRVNTEKNQDNGVGEVLVTLGLILTVSWDALWSGPAKSAQVIDWPGFWIWASFIVVGMVVSAFAVLSYLLAKTVAFKMSQPQWMLFDFGQWLQLSVVSYFAFLALLRYTFDVQWPWWQLLVCSFIFMAIVLHKLAINQLAKENLLTMRRLTPLV
jgi:hypothetical protein